MKMFQKVIFPTQILPLCLAVAVGFLPSDVKAAAITPGNLVIYRVGDGAAALNTTAASVFLDEYTVTGSLVQSLALPSTGSTALTAVGNSTTEGVISKSQDGNSLVFTGYRKNAGGSSPAGDASTTTSRVIGTLDASGTFSTATAVTDTGATAIRSATTTDGTLYYISTAAGVRYVGTPSGASTSTLIDSRNSRQVSLSGNTLYAANGSTTITAKVQHYGTLPTGSTAGTAVATLATGDAVNGFALFDLNPGIAGDDTLYALSTVENLLRKYTFDGTSWTASGSISASGAANLTGFVDSGSVNLFLTSATTLYGEVDSSGYNGTINGSLASLTTAGANTGFRGVGILAVPEPSTVVLATLGGLAVLLLRRRR